MPNVARKLTFSLVLILKFDKFIPSDILVVNTEVRYILKIYKVEAVVLKEEENGTRCCAIEKKELF